MLVPPEFTAVVADDATELGRACLLVAVTVRNDGPLDLDGQLARFDALAHRLHEPTLDGLTRLLFDELGFQGNAGDYYDPANSYLDQVLDRRRGIPITLSVLCLEVGRRAGVPLVGVGMPGHFLVRDQVDRSLFLDPFRRGARLDEEGCRTVFASIHGPRAHFDPSMLEPASNLDIVARILANLRLIFLRRNQPAALARVLALAASLPSPSAALLDEAARALAAIGRFDLAADMVDCLADADPSSASRHRDEAAQLRAKLN